VVLFFFPQAFTYVCPTELLAFDAAHPAFMTRNAAIIGASCDSAEVHLAWLNTPRDQGGLGAISFPLLADVSRAIAARYGALNAENVPNRAVYVVSPEVRVQCSGWRARGERSS